MADERKRKGGGGKLTRSQTVTVRLDPKLRYLAELAARQQRRTVSSYVEWAIEDSLNRVYLDSNNTIGELGSYLWDVDEPDRFAKLALTNEYLLTHEEQVLWKLIRETGHIWKGHQNADGEWKWSVREQSLIWDHLRKNWENFKSVASGKESRDILPKTSQKPPEFDDDVPF